MLGQYKKIILAIIVAVIVFGAYYFLNKDGTDAKTSTGVVKSAPMGKQTSESVLGNEILSVLGRVERITLDRGVFDDQVYKYLSSEYAKKKPKEIIEQVPGRENIFSPYVKDSSLSSGTVLDNN